MRKSTSLIALILYVLLCLTLDVLAATADDEWKYTQLKLEGNYKTVMTPHKAHLTGATHIIDGYGAFPMAAVDVCDKTGMSIWHSDSHDNRLSISCSAPQELNLFYVYQHPANYAQEYQLQILLDYEPVAFRVDKAAPKLSYTFTAGPESVRIIPITIPASQKKAALHDLVFIRQEVGGEVQTRDNNSNKRISVSTPMETHVLLQAPGCSPTQPPFVLHKLERQLSFIERIMASFSRGPFYVFALGLNKPPATPWKTSALIATAGSKTTFYVNFITSETKQWAGLLLLDNNIIPYSTNQTAVFWQSKAYGLMTAAFTVQLPAQKGLHTLTFKMFGDIYQSETRLFTNEKQFEIELR